MLKTSKYANIKKMLAEVDDLLSKSVPRSSNSLQA